ncbi:hypothetical protein HNQ27_15385 [Pseudomonas sp. B11D7D]|nr:hypothetical protein [Pseudomonas sp. B11D7D]QNH04088.1 hypothetical protein HNQ27_15385 [Pseudomonas sp. B11D7D]
MSNSSELNVKDNVEGLVKNSGGGIDVRWITEYQGFLTLVLIIVTAYLGWQNLVEQRKNNKLQTSIYSPSFVPTEYIPPHEIEGEYESKFIISNHGYVGGSYKVVVRSETFYLARRDFAGERKLSWEYYVPQGQDSAQEFSIVAPAKNIPLYADYHVSLVADGYGSRDYHFCYQSIGERKYKRIVCK